MLTAAQIGRFERVKVIQLLNQDTTKANISCPTRTDHLAGTAGPPTLKASPLDALESPEPEDTVVICITHQSPNPAVTTFLCSQQFSTQQPQN